MDQKTRIEVINRDGRCLKCGRTDRLVVDHVFPRSRGGGDEIGNLQTLCVPCNMKKGNRTDADYRGNPAQPVGERATYRKTHRIANRRISRSVSLTPNVHSALVELAKADHRSTSGYIEVIILDHLKSKGLPRHHVGLVGEA